MEPVAAEPDALSRRTALEAHAAETSACTRCRLAEGRTQVVYGVGDPDAELMFVGEAPGFHEDKQGYPFVGSAGKLLDAGHATAPQFLHLFRQLELIQPKLVATLGNFATKLLSGKPTGITRVHGRPQEALVGGRSVTLYPIYHPAAALYTPAMLKTLEEDFSRIPALLAGSSGQVAPAEAQVIRFPAPAVAVAAPAAPPAEQLGLF